VLLALSGFSYSAPERRLGFAPRVNARDFRCFFTAGEGWGVYRQRLEGDRALGVGLEVRHGVVRLRHLALRNEAAWREADVSTSKGSTVAAADASVRVVENRLDVDLGQEVAINEGQSLALTLRRS
jgi:hypothetical protein